MSEDRNNLDFHTFLTKMVTGRTAIGNTGFASVY